MSRTNVTVIPPKKRKAVQKKPPPTIIDLTATSTRSPTRMDRIIGDRIRVRRCERGLTQQELGDAIGVSFQQVQKYERGTNRAAPSRLMAIAKVLNTSVHYFLDDNIKTAESPYIKLMTSREGPRLMEAMVMIDDPRQRKMVVSLARQLAGLDGEEDRGDE